MEVFPFFCSFAHGFHFIWLAFSRLLFQLSSLLSTLRCAELCFFLFVVYTTNLQSGRVSFKLITVLKIGLNLFSMHEICIQLNCNENYHRIQSTLKLIETIQRTGHEIITASTFEPKLCQRNSTENECVHFQYTISSLKQNFILLFYCKKRHELIFGYVL